MERYLLRTKVVDWDYRKQGWTTKWAEGYIHPVTVGTKGPKFAFTTLEDGKWIFRDGEDELNKAKTYDCYFKETLSRYTGLTDNKGVKIFEGDVVEFNGGYAEGTWTGEVRYDERNALYVLVGFMPCRYDSRSDGAYEVSISSRDKTTFRVIGNRWDNPELLEVDK